MQTAEMLESVDADDPESEECEAAARIIRGLLSLSS